VSVRAQQSLIRPVVLSIVEGSTTPNPTTVNAVALSTLTGLFMCWNGSYWTGLGTTLFFASATVDFGFASGGEDSNTQVTVPATWVVSGSTIDCLPVAVATADHDPEDVVVEDIRAYTGNLVPGVSFDIFASAPNGTWGRYTVKAIGR
jgi:hypothetical protein